MNLIVLSVLCWAASAAAAETPAFTVGTRTSLPSKVLGEERPLLVYLPEGYAASPSTRYPVLYLLDGDTHFLHVVSMVEYLARYGSLPEMIVIAVPNTGDRVHDLTPPPSTTARDFDGRLLSEANPTAGGADRFLRFLTEELVPHVDAHYRTQPYRVLMGHSLGGLFAVHALVHKPESFNAYLAIAPSLHWNGGELAKSAPEAFSRLTAPGRVLYLTDNTADIDSLGGGLIRSLDKALQQRKPPALTWRYDEVGDEDHPSIPHRGTYYGLRFVFSGWKPDMKLLRGGDLARLETHYAGLTRRFGYPVLPPEGVLNMVAYQHLEAKHLPQALAIFERVIALYPNSPNAYDSLGDALVAAGRPQEALARYERAVALARDHQDPNLSVYQQDLEKLRVRLAMPPAH